VVAAAMASTSHYDVLGLVGEGKNASTEEIKRAYKSAALRCHPDKNGGDVAAFVAVNRAFETLSDPASRRAYDAALTSRLRQVVVSDEIDLEDMDVEEAGPPVTRTTAGEGGDPDFDLGWDETPLRYTYPCRCGDRYEVDGEDLHEDFDFVDVPCASCSLFTRVRYVQADE
jgi:diphthamide biosynthesis protein 4